MRYDTIVVGAGIAGLSAARFLSLSGQKCLVLEARDRVGGRVHSVKSDQILDHGASWIHGIDNNPLWQVCEGFGMVAKEFTVGSFQAGGRPIQYFSAEASPLTPQEAARFIEDVASFDLELEKIIALSPIGARRSYLDCVEETLRYCSTNLGWSETKALRVNEFMQHRTEEQYGAHASELDAHGLDDDQILGDEVVFAEGFARLASHLAKGLQVLLDHEVVAVRVLRDGAEIHTQDEIFYADQAIVTVPVSILKSDSFTFDPPLPEAHTKALDALEMNAFEKVFLTFETKFWPKNIYAIRQQGPHGDWWHSWYDVTKPGYKPTLLTFAAGPAGKAMRQMSDQDISDSVMHELRRLFGAETPDPLSTHVTRWQDDPHARGSYAYSKVGADPAGHDLLATPIADRLHIAGETTWGDDPATVTAALMSGHRAAQNVLQKDLQFEMLVQ